MRRTRWRKAPDECGFSNLVGEGDEHGQCCCRWLSLGMRRISITGTCGANKRGFQHDRNTERRTGARARSEHRTKHGDRAGAPFVGGVICPCRAPHGLPYFHRACAQTFHIFSTQHYISSHVHPTASHTITRVTSLVRVFALEGVMGSCKRGVLCSACNSRILCTRRRDSSKRVEDGRAFFSPPCAGSATA